MPNVNYIITIRDSTGGSAKTKPKSTASTANGSSVKNNGEDSGGNKRGMGLASYHYAKQAVNTAITAELNRVELRTGHRRLQERINFGYSTAKSVFDIGESLAIGAMFGGVAGAAISATATTVTKLISMGIAMQDLNIQREVESIGISFVNIRAGAGGDRTGNSIY